MVRTMNLFNCSVGGGGVGGGGEVKMAKEPFKDVTSVKLN